MNARRTPFGLFAVVALLAVVAYGAALTGVYVFDDIHSVDANPALHDPALRAQIEARGFAIASPGERVPL